MSPVLGDADKVYVGSQVVDKAYVGAARVYPKFLPTDLAGLVVWFDASQLLTPTVGAEERMVANTPVPAATSTGSYNLGHRFTPTVDGWITHIRWWHTQSCADTHYLSIWNQATGVRMAYIADVPGSSTGWRERPLPSPLPVKAGVVYIVSYQTTHTWSYTVATPASLAPSLGSVAPIYAAYDSMPANVAGNIYFADVVFQTLSAGDVSQWVNLGSGPAGTMVGTPVPRILPNRCNGKNAVRFNYNQGRLRIASVGADVNWTLAYVARMVGPVSGRGVSGNTGSADFLIGWHGGSQNAFYCTAHATPDARSPYTNAWKLYSGDSPGRLFSNGTLLSSTSARTNNRFDISGYSAAGAEETSDIEVAEAVLYSSKLSDVDRQRVEAYLRTKWAIT